MQRCLLWLLSQKRNVFDTPLHNAFPRGVFDVRAVRTRCCDRRRKYGKAVARECRLFRLLLLQIARI